MSFPQKQTPRRCAPSGMTRHWGDFDGVEASPDFKTLVESSEQGIGLKKPEGPLFLCFQYATGQGHARLVVFRGRRRLASCSVLSPNSSLDK